MIVVDIFIECLFTVRKWAATERNQIRKMQYVIYVNTYQYTLSHMDGVRMCNSVRVLRLKDKMYYLLFFSASRVYYTHFHCKNSSVLF